MTQRNGCGGRRKTTNRKDAVTRPEPLDFGKPEEFDDWMFRFERFRRISGLAHRPPLEQVDWLVYSLGRHAEQLYPYFDVKCPSNKLYEVVVQEFRNYLRPGINVINERAKFNQRVQEPEEPAADFIKDLNRLSFLCRFKELREELVRDRIVVGIRDKKLSQQLRSDPRLTRDKATELVTSRERENKKTKCHRCGTWHGSKGRCPAWGALCTNCHNRNHWARQCWSKPLEYDSEQQEYCDYDYDSSSDYSTDD